MTPSLEGWPTKAKEAPSPHEVRLAPLDTNPIFQSLGENSCMCLYQRPQNLAMLVLVVDFIKHCMGIKPMQF